VTESPGASAHVDNFVRDRLPRRELWPQMDWSGADLRYPARFNCASNLLDSWIEAGHGGRTALHHSDGPWTYGRLFETANRIAHLLVDECGLVPGGRVLLRAPNHPMLVACWFAVIKAGGVAVSTMPLLRVRELTEIIDKAGVSLALTDAAVAGDLEAALASRPGARVVHFNAAGERSLEAVTAAQSPRFDNVLTAADDPAIIAFTSGTTGRSKGTVHFHRDLMAVTDTYARHVLRPGPDDIFIGSPPLAFTYALGGHVLFPMRVGASAVMLEQATPPLLLEGIQKYRATIAFTSPTGYRAMLADARAFDLSSLRKCVSAGEPLPASTFDAWLATVGIRLMDGIGSTELLHVFIGCTAEDARPGSTGRVVPGYRARVVDDEGKDVPVGTVGRLAVSGPTGCRYLDDVESQQKYVQQGWNLTGDAYRVDEHGYFWYQSRTDDMIVTSGYNVAGPEVENVLLAHAAVAECAVVGVPDDARGQLVKAFIVTSAGVAASDALAKDLQDYVKSQLAPYKYPRAVEFVTELPRTLTGKIQRFRLRHANVSKTAGARPDDPQSEVAFHEPESWARPKGFANAVSAAGRLVFVAGQVGWDPATHEFASDAFVDQIRQALTNVVGALAAAGARPDQITRLTWYITDRESYLSNQRAIGEHYRAIIGRHFPAMSVVVVRGLLDPRAQVEIEVTAVC
jgi:2-aminobenzoate-CoA ligase